MQELAAQAPEQTDRVQKPAAKVHKSVASAQEPAPDPQEEPTSVPEPPRLWMDVSMGPDLLDWYNETAHPVDMARADHVSQIDLLENVEVGRRLVVFKNVSDAEALLPRLADKMDIIGYNLEHGPANRPDEGADPVGSVRRMRALADEYGLELALGPDRTFALNDGVAMAPYVDIFVLQVQRVQTEPDVVREFVVPLAAQLRAVNPDLEISVQVRTEGDPVAIADLVKSMEDSLDGVSILTNGESTDIAQAIVAELRPPASDAPVQAPATTEPSMPESNPSSQPGPSPSKVQAVALPTATAAPRRTQTETPVAATTTVAAANTQETELQGGWLFVGSVAALGILVASLLTTVALYAVQKIRR